MNDSAPAHGIRILVDKRRHEALVKRLPRTLALVVLAISARGADIAGDWLTSDGKAQVRMAPSADGKTETGTIVWLQSPNDDSGQPRHDDQNPDPALRTRPVLGLALVTGLKPDGDGGWEDGRVYDPMSGKTYRCKASLGEDGKSLKLRGFIGISLLGRTETWTRVVPPSPNAQPQKK